MLSKAKHNHVRVDWISSTSTCCIYFWAREYCDTARVKKVRAAFGLVLIIIIPCVLESKSGKSR